MLWTFFGGGGGEDDAGGILRRSVGRSVSWAGRLRWGFSCRVEFAAGELVGWVSIYQYVDDLAPKGGRGFFLVPRMGWVPLGFDRMIAAALLRGWRVSQGRG